MLACAVVAVNGFRRAIKGQATAVFTFHIRSQFSLYHLVTDFTTLPTETGPIADNSMVNGTKLHFFVLFPSFVSVLLLPNHLQDALNV